mmetsp:Transcript_22571/g.64542  ORF Transcript_22571/g.64542 Transcript_22571/m.64542 type:complete len:200 (+) Transcript_22571:157-756(+)
MDARVGPLLQAADIHVLPLQAEATPCTIPLLFLIDMYTHRAYGCFCASIRGRCGVVLFVQAIYRGAGCMACTDRYNARNAMLTPSHLTPPAFLPHRFPLTDSLCSSGCTLVRVGSGQHARGNGRLSTVFVHTIESDGWMDGWRGWLLVRLVSFLSHSQAHRSLCACSPPLALTGAAHKFLTQPLELRACSVFFSTCMAR